MSLRKRIPTILEITSEIKDSVTITTDRDFNYSAYVLNRKQIKGTESGSIVAKLPKKSNIHKMDKILDKFHKSFVKDADILVSANNGNYRKYYTDGLGTITASKFENQDGVTYTMRGDVASGITMQGNLFVQCNQSVCDLLLPRKIDVDLTKFAITKVER